ncbi:MAG: molybdopterin-dependent oxidoreductase [Anaerolineaceae bacterium]|nr:molybdopterin-dependent oxidoreductase [Anaerolineaceae bacterium]
MVHLTIDGKQIEVVEGTTVLRAAQQNGIHIPTLCDHPHLTPYGGCRLCLVDIKGARTLQPSCTMPVSEGMEVTTRSEQITDARKFVLSMIFSERNHFCPYCQVSGGDCELQSAAYEQDMTHWMIQPNWETYPVDASHPYFIYESNRCILCRRCVRACGELVGNFTLGFEQRGAASFLVADLGVPLGESSCVSCGTCVQVCPTGSLTDRRSSYRGLHEDTTTIKSVCTGCSVGCGIEAVVRDNNLIAINGDWDAPINQGVLCKNGRYQELEKMDKAVKLTSPMLRKNGSLTKVSWEEALDFAAKAIKNAEGKLAAAASTRLSTEALYSFKSLFADHLGSDMVTASEIGLHTKAQSAYAVEIGKSFESDLEAVKNADCVITVGEDLINAHETIGFMVKRNLPNGTKLICIDTDTSAYGNLADSAVKVNENSEAAAISGVAAALVKLGLSSCDCAACAAPDETVQAAAKATGVSSETFLDIAYALSTAKSPVFIYGGSVTADPSAEALKAIACLAEMIDAKMVSPKGNTNSMTAAQFGLDGSFCAKDRETVVVALGDEDVCGKLLASIKDTPTKVVLSCYANELTETADVILPVTNWSQEGGHFVNLFGKIQWSQKLVDADGSAKSSTEVITTIAEKIGVSLDDNWKDALLARPASVQIA